MKWDLHIEKIVKGQREYISYESLTGAEFYPPICYVYTRANQTFTWILLSSMPLISVN